MWNWLALGDEALDDGRFWMSGASTWSMEMVGEEDISEVRMSMKI
jgi:hypothetical protein